MAVLPESPNPPCRRSAALVCHPAAGCQAARTLEGWVCLVDEHRLSVGFTLQGDLDRLAIPGPGAPQRTDRLWEHTCFEAFLAVPGEDTYWELNLSPGTEWAAYRFPRYREGGVPAPGLEPRIAVQRSPQRLDLQATAALDGLDTGRGLQIGLSAVIESRDGQLSYWALRHGPGRPDFHHRAGFALELRPGARA